MGGIISALRTLTCIPVPGRDAKFFGDALTYFPLVGSILGVIFFGLAWGLNSLGMPALAASIILLSWVLITRGFHLDGLADVADGFWGGYTPERRLEIMKDSRVGVFGVLALILGLAIKGILIYYVLIHEQRLLLAAAPLIARSWLSTFMVSAPYARKDSNDGKAGPFLSPEPKAQALAALWIGLAAVFFLMDTPGVVLWFALIPFLLLFRSLCFKKIKGVTGDTFGAFTEIAEILILLMGLLAQKWFSTLPLFMERLF